MLLFLTKRLSNSMGKGENKVSILAPKPPENEKLRFSFEFYDGSKYCLSSWIQEDVKQTLSRLKEICKLSFNDMRRMASTYHFHEVDWKSTTEKSGFPIRSVNGLSAFQFALLGVNHQKARVYGAYYGGIFYIVWFDFEHSITPSFRKNT